MKDTLSRYTLRVEQALLDKLGYIAEYEGRTKNRELEQMIKKRIAEFEKEHGEIQPAIKRTADGGSFYCLLLRFQRGAFWLLHRGAGEFRAPARGRDCHVAPLLAMTV